MEWMRNKQDSWHLARSNSRKSDGCRKNNNNKDEESYFEGTGNQKSKKNRKVRQTEASTTVQTGFSMAAGPSSPPAVNAWTQKKGSALFNKHSEEVDEEDEMLKLALKESIKTAEEEKRRHQERMKMMNLEIPPTVTTEDPIEKEWDEEEQYSSQFEEEYSPNPPAANRDLMFVDTDDISPPSQRRRPPLLRTRKSSNEEVPALKNNVESSLSYNTASHKDLNLPKNGFESPHKNEICTAVCETSYDQTKQSLLTEAVTPRIDENNKRESNVSLDSGLNLDFASKLTLGDTQGLSEINYDNYSHVSHNVPNHLSFNTPNYESIDQKHSVPIPVPKSPDDLSNLSVNIDDTDRMLHSFIRHDPPPLSFTQNSTEMLASNTPQHFLLPNSFEENKHHLNGLASDNPPLGLKNCNVQNSFSPEASLPFQNVSPNEMSIGKEITGLPDNAHQMYPQNSHFLFPYAMNIQNNLEASNNLQPVHLSANSNVPSQMTCLSAPPGYTFLHQSARSVPPGLNQYGYNSTNTMVHNASSMAPITNTMIPNASTMVPNTNTMIPNTNTMIPNSSSMGPNTNMLIHNASTMVPNSNTLIPNTSTMVTNTNTMIPNSSSMVMNTNMLIPNTNTMIPNTNTMIPNTSSMVPNTNTMIPNSSSMGPNTNTMIPNSSSMVMNTNMLIPNTNTMVPNANTMIPNTSSMVPNANTLIDTDLRNLMPQQYQHAVTMNAYDPFQQSHLISSSISPNAQTNVPNESQLSPKEDQSPMVAQQNQLLQYQLQMMSALNQHQMNMMRGNLMQKPAEFPIENNQQMTEQGIQQPTGKTRDELQQEYHQAMQYINHLQHQLANAAQQSQGQALPYGFPPTSLPLPMTNNMFHPGMQMMSVSQQTLPQVPGQISPITSTSMSNIHSMINSETGLIQSTSDPTVGRGRGRLQ